MLEGVFYVIILPICLNPARLDGNPLLVVDDAPTDLLDVFNALCIDIGSQVMRLYCLYF